MLASACSVVSPSWTSRITRPNSVEIGGWVSRTTSSVAWRNDDPERNALLKSVIVSARRELKAFRRFCWRRWTYMRGSRYPSNAATTSISGLARSFTNVCPSSQNNATIANIARTRTMTYSSGRSVRSARARSRATRSLQARRSTTRLGTVNRGDLATVSRNVGRAVDGALLTGGPTNWSRRSAAALRDLPNIPTPTRVRPRRRELRQRAQAGPLLVTRRRRTAPAGNGIPITSNFSEKRGRTPVGRSTPRIWPSSTPLCSKTKMSCMTITSPSMPCDLGDAG